MSDNDLIRRGDALAAIQLGDTVTKLQARIRAIPYVDADPVCTGCGGTGVTYQTERRCACQGPDLTDPVTVHANMLRGTIAKPTVDQIIHLYGRDALMTALVSENEVVMPRHLYWTLRSYAAHDNDCKLNKPPHFDGPCSCGLTAALKNGEALTTEASQ